ncbi:MAG: cytochrome c peroxidase [Planctomycetota bacterium]
MAQTAASATAEAKIKAKLGDSSLTAGIPGKGPLTVAEVTAWLAKSENHVPLEVELPLGLATGSIQITGLTENPLTRAKIELGRQLYFDTRLSSDNTVSCASCHHPDEGYGRNTQFGIGVQGQQGGRNSPVSFNRILSSLQFWDGRAASLEEQAKGPIANPIEMANTHEKAIATLKSIPGYVQQFEAVFGAKGLNIDTVAQAIASFERCLVTGPSPYDFAEQLKRFEKLSADDIADIKADDPELYATYLKAVEEAKKSPLSDSARRGRELYFSERINCAACHVGANLADEKYHNIGVGMDKPMPDEGRFAITKKPEDWGAFKTPTLRNVAQSGPYMHDGSQKTLEEVVEHYNKGGIPNKNLSNKIKKLDLKDQEKKDLVDFMKACTGSFPKMETARLPK